MRAFSGMTAKLRGCTLRLVVAVLGIGTILSAHAADSTQKGPQRSDNYWLRFNNSEMGSVFAGRLSDAGNNVVFNETFRRFQAAFFYLISNQPQQPE